MLALRSAIWVRRTIAQLTAKVAMMSKIKKWLNGLFSATPAQPKPRPHGINPQPRPRKATPPKPELTPDFAEAGGKMKGHVESLGPGKNVFVRNRFVREETGTHETLKIIDDSVVDSGEETGLDPYNTGQFDRSKKWEQRFRK